MDYCAPNINGKQETCLSTDIIRKIAKAYNENRAKDDNDKIPLNLPKIKIYNLINDKISNTCKVKGDLCIVNQDFVKSLISSDNIEEHLKPENLEGKDDWLSNIDIRKVIKQYQKTHPNFEFIGPVPIDFDLMIRQLRNFSLKKSLHYGKNKIGIVFNLDPHDKSGSHWVSLFADFSDKNNAEITFFDSTGDKPPHQISTLMKRMKDQAKSLNFEPTVKYNKIQHQYKNNECGVYSINYIVSRLNGKSFDQVCKNKIKDNEMNKCRNFYFRPHTSKVLH